MPVGVCAAQTTRQGGVSQGPWHSLNLATHTGDDPSAVEENRCQLTACLELPRPPQWLQQVHGTRVVAAEQAMHDSCADAVVARHPGWVCAVQTADCLPVLFCSKDASVVAAAHAGWRGLCAGVLEATITAMAVTPSQIMAWLGPAIGPEAFEVGPEVREAFCAEDAASAAAFRRGSGDRYWADIYHLARLRLTRTGVTRIYGGGACTYTQSEEFFSYRRTPVCGRMASLIWR